ncbi:MAG TPA: DNA methyltransferase [Candidatus Saccharimonadales bacterium]|nr:DNA methyltransferase [Candidatus Saccharimonadales bacterium]
MELKSVYILGRQPAIGCAELESLLGAEHIKPVGEHAVASDQPLESALFARLGGSVKAGVILDIVPYAQINQLTPKLTLLALTCAKQIDEGKIQIGISAYGVKTNPAQLLALGLNIKKGLRAHKYSVRLTPNQELELSSAQVIHNHLTGERGIELLLIRNSNEIIIARTTAVQDISGYSKRDQGRPKRDAFVGMLPPKLAQTIVNLACYQLPTDRNTVVLDPFCGTGVLLQEALLMGYGVYGSDLETRMIDFSAKNLDWLSKNYGTPAPQALEVGDATSHTWNEHFSTIACETYLGHPLGSWPKPAKLQQIIGTCNVIIDKFMRNIAAQIPAGTRLCLAIPAWVAPNGHFYHLPVLDHLEKMGYNRVSFKHSREVDLVYHRSDQIVARELLVITRK